MYGGLTKLKNSYIKFKRTAVRVISIVCMGAMLIMIAGCHKNETKTEDKHLSPKETIEEIFTLTKEKDYDTLASYCRSFSKRSMELYFTDTGTEYDDKWLSRYSDTLAEIFKNYVTYDNLTEKTDKDARTGSVTGTFTCLDMEKFNEKTDSKISSEMKNDFNAQMDYIDSMIGDSEFRSDKFELTIEFRYTNDEWVLVDKNFLILLTLGYYNK